MAKKHSTIDTMKRTNERGPETRRGRAKLTVEQVAIARKYRGNVAKLARSWGVEPRALYAVRRGETWKEIK